MNADTLRALLDQTRRIRDISVDVANELARACDKPNNPFGAALEAERAHLENRISSLTTDLEICRADKHSLASRFVALQEEYDKLNKLLTAYKEDNAKLICQSNEAQASLAASQSALKLANNEREAAIHGLGELKTENTKLSRLLGECRAANRRLFDTSDANEKRLRKLMAAIKTAIEQDKT